MGFGPGQGEAIRSFMQKLVRGMLDEFYPRVLITVRGSPPREFGTIITKERSR